MVTRNSMTFLIVSLAAALLAGCSTDAQDSGAPPDSAATSQSSSAPARSIAGPPRIPCDGERSVADLVRNSPDGTIAVTADVPDTAPRVTKLQGGVEVQAVFPLQNVKQVAGPRGGSLPGEISTPMSPKSVPLFLPHGSYLLLVYRDLDSDHWTVLMGSPGMFKIIGSSAQERCTPAPQDLNATQEEVLKAEQAAPHGPVEPLSGVISTINDELLRASGDQ